MKNIVKIALIMLVAMLTFSCELFEIPEAKIIARIASYESDLNADNYSNLINHYHPDMPSRSLYADISVYDTSPISSDKKPFSFGTPAMDVTGDDAVYAAGTFTSSATSSGTYTAELRESGGEWLFYYLKITVSGNDFLLKSVK